MPRDDWAKARAKDFGRKAKASGNYCGGGDGNETTPFFHRKRRNASIAKAPWAVRPACAKCGSSEETLSKKTFKDKTVHIRVDCAGCGAYKQWAKQ